MPIALEGKIGAAPQAHRRALEIAQRGIEVNREHIGQVGRRGDGQLVARLVRVVLAGNHFQVLHLHAILEPALAIGHEGKFAHRHAIDCGDGQTAHTALEVHVQDGAINGHAVGVGAVENHKILAVLGSGLHQVDHRYIIGVESQSHILQIGDNDIELVHRLLAGIARLAVVERGDGNARLLIDAAAHMFTSIGLATKSVLGRENDGHIQSLLEHHIEHMLVAHRAGLVAQ